MSIYDKIINNIHIDLIGIAMELLRYELKDAHYALD